MRVLTCLTQDHNLWLVLLAALVCFTGSYVSARLYHHTVTVAGPSRFYWCVLASVSSGAAIWSTHFIAMLGYRAPVTVSFDGALTVVSALIAIVGTGLGLVLAMQKNRMAAVLSGGGMIGLSIAAMHYVGMYAYKVDGIVRWEPGYVAASIVAAMLACILALRLLLLHVKRPHIVRAAALLAGGIIVLHFTGMAAFVVIPVDGMGSGMVDEAFVAMASAVALVAFLIVAAGISTHLLEKRTVTESEAKLQHIALHDSLTGIANRRAFSDALDDECTKLVRYGRPFALLAIDLDRFKPVNDTFGHPVGDEVLRRVAARLSQTMRAGDLLARVGGDEFAIIAYGVSKAAEAEEIAARIVELMSRPFVIDGQIAEIGASVGVTLAPLDGETAEVLTHRTDVALYTVKQNGKDGYCLFKSEMSDALLRRRAIETDLRRACMREEFNVVYQPITDAATGAITSAEALLRWTCEGRGEVSPAEFIPIAEDLGLVTRIGAGVLKQACRDAAAWPADITLSVNISPVQLLDPRLPQTVQQALQESGLAGERLDLEITETALIGNDQIAMETLCELRDLGVRISLDDFGTGYSSLSYLHRFPISRIKIDKSFVQKLPGDAGSISIFNAIAQLGKAMNLKITAEGIETDEQLAFASANGCHNLQGFLISRPIPCENFVSLLCSMREPETV